MVGPDLEVSVSQINPSFFKLLLVSVLQWQQKSKGDMMCLEVFNLLPFLYGYPQCCSEPFLQWTLITSVEI